MTIKVGDKIKLSVEVNPGDWQTINVEIESLNNGKWEFKEPYAVVTMLEEEDQDEIELAVVRLDTERMTVDIFGMEIGGLDTVAAKFVEKEN